MKFLLIPENNSLSHITKCLSIKDILEANGNEVHLAVSKKHAAFLNQLRIKHHILSDIQETDSGGFPSFKWFSKTGTIVDCIKEETALINKIKPDRVLGVFRFTLFASSRLADVPYDSLICGCMIPESQEILGFSEDDAGADLQEKFLNNFFRFAGKKTSLALSEFGLNKIDDIRYALKGERTYLWDFPEFMPLQKKPGIIHAGPIALNRWPYEKVNLDKIIDSKLPLAVVSFGTCISDKGIVQRIVNILLDLNYKVILAAGGQKELLEIEQSDSRITALNFAPLTRIFPHASLLVTHGGQMTVFEALQNKVPVFVMPLQPEQAHNGLCLERAGCGKRLIPPTLFTGDPVDFISAFHKMSDVDIKAKINDLVQNNKTKENLTEMQNVITRYHGTKTIADFLEAE